MAGERSSVPAPARPAPPVPGGRREHPSSQSSSGHHHGRGRERGIGSSAGSAQHRGPQQIGDYEIVKTLGTGSFGKVKRELLHRYWQTAVLGSGQLYARARLESAHETSCMGRKPSLHLEATLCESLPGWLASVSASSGLHSA